MRRFGILIGSLFVLGHLNGCVYSSAITPLDENVQETKLGTKTGRASVYIVAWLFAWGDGGVAAAARNGDLKVINHLDVERRLFLFGLFSEITTIAYGE
jgi:hypothetical protein